MKIVGSWAAASFAHTNLCPPNSAGLIYVKRLQASSSNIQSKVEFS